MACQRCMLPSSMCVCCTPILPICIMHPQKDHRPYQYFVMLLSFRGHSTIINYIVSHCMFLERILALIIVLFFGSAVTLSLSFHLVSKRFVRFLSELSPHQILTSLSKIVPLAGWPTSISQPAHRDQTLSVSKLHFATLSALACQTIERSQI